MPLQPECRCSAQPQPQQFFLPLRFTTALISPSNFPPIPISPSLFPCCPSLSRTRSQSRVTRRVILTSTHGHLALLICLWYTFFSPHRHNESGILSFLTQAGGVKGGMSLTLPFPSTVACAQTLEQVALRVAFSPGIPDPVGGQRILVVTAVYERVV